jgi:hypothetical protein
MPFNIRLEIPMFCNLTCARLAVAKKKKKSRRGVPVEAQRSLTSHTDIVEAALAKTLAFQ